MKFVTTLLFFLFAVSAFAQKVLNDTLIKKEPFGVAELGGAANAALKGGDKSFGYSIAVEVTPIEDWLELELGVSPTFGTHLSEREVDLLFKKPWTLSPKVEFMFGVGLAWDHTVDNSITTNAANGEVALDFMFWPGAKHKFGWYLEPAYEYGLGQGHEQSFGISAGLLVTIP